MAFRKNTEKSLSWQKWLRKNRAELIGCGVPDVVFEEFAHWDYFLWHGYFTPAGGTEAIIDIESMTPRDQDALCKFLEQDDVSPYNYALNRLQYILKRGKHAGRAD